MLGLPKSTELNKRIPKQKFYENLNVPVSVTWMFIDMIKTIYWRNKVSAETMNLAPGDGITEFEVYEVRLNDQRFDESALRLIDKEIPHHILFVLEYFDKYQAWTAYKEAPAPGASAYKVGTYYHTNWLWEEEFPLRAEGLSVNQVYENFVRQIAGYSF